VKIVLGVVDIPYADTSETKPKMTGRVKRGRKAAKPEATSGAKSTGEVAEILEGKYGVMQAFYTKHETDIASQIEDVLQGQIENIMAGSPISANPLAEATSGIEDMFKQFLSGGEIESMGIEGVPTQAALDRVNHRLKRGKGPDRPSFIDTGLYQASFAAEVE